MAKILAIPGSLRASSSSNHIMNAAITMAPPEFDVEIFEGVGNLPHFNDPTNAPDSVVAFRKKIKDADGILIVTPEYAFGVPGSLKNALDWTVGTGEFVDKPVGLITAASHGEKAHAAFLLILNAISARVQPDATLLIQFVRAKLDSSGAIIDPEVSKKIETVLMTLASSIET